MFLIKSGINGVFRRDGNVFYRWMFNDWQEFSVSFKTKLAYLFALLVFACLAVMSTMIATVTAARSVMGPDSKWPSHGMLSDLTLDLLVFLAPACALALLYAAAGGAQRLHVDRRLMQNRRDTHQVSVLYQSIWFVLLITATAAVVAGVLVLWHLALHYGREHDAWWPDFALQSVGLNNPAIGPQSLISCVWLGVFILNLVVRSLLIDYMGDVAAYVAAHAANKFFEIRCAIQKRTKDVAAAVYAMRHDDGRLLYDRIVFVGHSLGSVVAYDTLNALLLDEDLGALPDGPVRTRTSHLVTFGSPLDKTAFLFREQQPRFAQVREALAASVQPLIQDYRFRASLRWQNFFSRADLISGRLEYYDEDEFNRQQQGTSADRFVHNDVDPYACIPLMAHTMYWHSSTVGRYLLEIAVP